MIYIERQWSPAEAQQYNFVLTKSSTNYHSHYFPRLGFHVNTLSSNPTYEATCPSEILKVLQSSVHLPMWHLSSNPPNSYSTWSRSYGYPISISLDLFPFVLSPSPLTADHSLIHSFTTWRHFFSPGIIFPPSLISPTIEQRQASMRASERVLDGPWTFSFFLSY